MIRGTIRFCCSECDETFKAVDIEYRATTFSVPMQCPRCKSNRTFPCGWLGKYSYNRIAYKVIWEKENDNGLKR
ncbi:hypothetical protein D0T85_13350 [Bacteroides sp. 519]|nr:hypothetical protein [Bacteroides sp. 519]